MTSNNHPPGGERPHYPSQGVPTKIDRRCLPLLRMLKEWTGIKAYRMVMLLVVNEVRAHPDLLAALPPEYREGLEGLEEELVGDLAVYARWAERAARPAPEAKGGKKGKRPT